MELQLLENKNDVDIGDGEDYDDDHAGDSDDVN